MDSHAAKASTALKHQGLVALDSPTAAAWLRAIIRTVGTNVLTLDEIQRGVGEIIVTPETAAVEEYVHVLIEENVITEADEAQHFALTESGRTLLEGVLASPAAEASESSSSN